VRQHPWRGKPRFSEPPIIQDSGFRRVRQHPWRGKPRFSEPLIIQDSSAEKPVGTIYISVWFNGEVVVRKFNLPPRLNRKNMKFMFTEKALEFALEMLSEE
jgi:hypothetical protein